MIMLPSAIEDELEAAFAGKITAQQALDEAVRRGDKLLSQFERTGR
jgi:sn-glycerol 3-phosphate transport system substrate-binding protein